MNQLNPYYYVYYSYDYDNFTNGTEYYGYYDESGNYV